MKLLSGEKTCSLLSLIISCKAQLSSLINVDRQLCCCGICLILMRLEISVYPGSFRELSACFVLNVQSYWGVKVHCVGEMG